MTDRELLELIAAQVGSLTKDVSEFKKGQKEVENEVRKISETIENDIKPKIIALFDGHTQINNQLDRIEKEVS